MPLTTLLERLGTEETSRTAATEFSGYVKKLPNIGLAEKLVLSQVLVPPLVQEYVAVKQEWMKQKLWKLEDFIEVLDESCSEEMKPRVIEALHTFLELRMDAHIKDLKSKKDPNWKRLLVESFEMTLSDPKVSSNVQKYIIPDTDPVEALRGQQGLKTVMASDMFVIGVFRSRTMFELPTYLEQERMNSPPGFQKSPYWWALEMDRYAVDGNPYCPEWMSCANDASKKRKRSAGKVSKWSEGYGITHSAFGYGNETVLCNDPHPTPWSNLDDAEVNQEASDKGNVRVRICRIGPWVFPIQITTSFLPKGTPLLYYYGKGYWVTARADQALATMADERESLLRREQEQTQRENDALKQEQAQLQRENAELKGYLQDLHHRHGHAALKLVQASLEAGRAIAALSEGTSDRHPAPAVKYETPTRQLIPSAVTPDGVDAPAHAEAFPEEPFQCAAGTSQSQPASTNSVHTPKAGRQLDPVLGINKAGLADETVGQLQATLGQPVMEPRASGTSAPGMFIDVQGLRQGLGSVLQQMTHLAANLHGLEQQQQLQQQQQHLPESRNLNPAEPHQAQHGNAAGAVNASESVQTTGDQDKLVAAEQLVTHVPTSLQQHSMHSMRQEAEQACKKPPTVQPLSGAVVRQHHESTLQADGQHAGMIMQAVMCDGAANAVSTPFGIEHVPGNKPIGLDEEENRQERRPIAPQEQDVISQKAARQSGVKHKGSKPRCSKKRKKNETAGRAEADSGNQPEAEAAALRQPSQDVPMQWGGKQKRKHIRQASSGLPDQACRASQQRLLRPYSDTPVADHPSEGPSCPAVKPSATSAAGVLCDAKGKRLQYVTAGMGSSGTTPAQTSPRADAQSPGADAHSPMLRQPSTPAAGVSAIEAAAGKTCLKDPAAHSLDQAGGRQQTQGLSSIGGSMRRDSSSSSSSEEEHSGDGNSPATSHVEAHAARAVADADGAAAGADADADRADAGRALTTSGAEPSLQTEGSAGGAVVLNTPETSFAVLDCRQVNVGSSDLAPVSAQQTILAAVDTHAPCYALATDVLEACGIHHADNPSKTIKQLLSWERAGRGLPDKLQAAAPHASTSVEEVDACQITKVYWHGHSEPAVVFGVDEVRALLQSPAVPEASRNRLWRFTAGLSRFGWALNNPPGSQQCLRADGSSPEIEISVDRESDSGTDQVRANQKGSAASSPAGTNPHTASTLNDLPATMVEGNLSHPEGPSPRAVSQHMKARTRSGSQAITTDGSMQTEAVMRKHGSAAAAAQPVLANALRSLPASQQTGSQWLLPTCGLHESCPQMRSESKPSAGSCEPAVSNDVDQAHLRTSGPNGQASGDCAMLDASVSMSGSMRNLPENPFGGNGNEVMLGKRKRARKSTRSSYRQPAASVQQSNAVAPKGADGVPNSKHVVLIKDIDNNSDMGQDSNSNKPLVNDDVIDLTDDSHV